MLVTNQAKLIRIGLESLRVIGRASAGVRLFDVANAEHVVSAVRIDEPEEQEELEEGGAAAETIDAADGTPTLSTDEPTGDVDE